MKIRMTAAMLAALTLALNGCTQNAEAAVTTAAQTAEAAGTESAQTETAGTAAVQAETASSATETTVEYRETYPNSEDNSHAISADGETAAYDHILVQKTGDGEGDEADFYGTNAAVYAENGGQLTITDSRIETSGSHANAVFSYGEGTVINISDSVIETSKNNSGGIMVTGGGTLNAENLDVTTQGGSSAAIRSDRGGGTLNVNGGTYQSYGSGSPAIYSTADITVSNAELYSDISQAVVVEGKNSVTLSNTNAVGKNTKKNSDKSDYFQAVMIYQSMSGDAAEGKGSFTMNGGSLTSLNGGMFFVNNTVAEISLNKVELNYASDDLLRICAAGWGNQGSNGGQVTFTGKDQDLKGVVTVDEISSLNLILNGDSSFEGSIDNTGEVYVELNDQSVWKLTADSSVTSLTCSANAIDLNGFTLTVGGTEYVEGTSSEGSAIEVKAAQRTGGHGSTPPEGMGNPPEGMGNPPEGMGNPPEGMGNPPEKPEHQGKPEMNGQHGMPEKSML